MSKNLEIEAKALVSEDDYLKLVKAFKKHKPYIQTNHYLDSTNRILNKNGLSLRVREKNGVLELTLKAKQNEGRLEENIIISEEQFENIKKGIFFDGPILDVLFEKGINPKELKILSSLTTKRIDAHYGGGLLSIDENHYGTETDYEVELEHSSMKEAVQKLKALFEKNGIEYKENHKSKTSRALKSVKKKTM